MIEKLESLPETFSNQIDPSEVKPQKKQNKKKRRKKQKKVESDDEDFMLNQLIAENKRIYRIKEEAEYKTLYDLMTSSECRRKFEVDLFAKDNEYESLPQKLKPCKTIEQKEEALRLWKPELYVAYYKV